MAISFQIPSTLSFMDFIGLAGFIVTYLAFVLGFLLVGVPMLISDRRKKLVGWLCVASALVILVAGPLAWYLVAYNKWGWLTKNGESVFRILFFVGYCGFFAAYRRAMRRIELAQQADRRWSGAPFQYIELEPTECVIGVAQRSILFDVAVRNTFGQQRTVWISGNIGVYRRSALDNAAPICIIPICVFSVDVPGNAKKIATQPLHATLAIASMQAIESAVEIDSGVDARIVDLSVSTITHLSDGTPRTSTMTSGLQMRPIPVKVLP